MQISESAKKMLQDIIRENEADGLQATLEQSCCSVAPVFQLVRFEEGDAPEVIDEIAVLAAPDVKEALNDVLIDVLDGELVVLNPTVGCTGECDGHDHDDHECCGGHGHDDDHECCGGHGHDDDHECCGGHGHDDDHECCGGHGSDEGCCCH